MSAPRAAFFPLVARSAERMIASRLTSRSTICLSTGIRAASAVGSSAAVAISPAILASGNPSPVLHSTTKGDRTNGARQFSCGQSCTITIGISDFSAARTNASSSSLGSPAMMRTAIGARTPRGSSPTTTAPGRAPAESSFASCSASIPLTTTGPSLATRCSSRSAETTFFASTRVATIAALTTTAGSRASRGRGSPGGRRSAAGS